MAGIAEAFRFSDRCRGVALADLMATDVAAASAPEVTEAGGARGAGQAEIKLPSLLVLVIGRRETAAA
mgnify:CR=1 FL=1